MVKLILFLPFILVKIGTVGRNFFPIKFILYFPKWTSGDKNLCSTFHMVKLIPFLPFILVKIWNSWQECHPTITLPLTYSHTFFFAQWKVKFHVLWVYKSHILCSSKTCEKLVKNSYKLEYNDTKELNSKRLHTLWPLPCILATHAKSIHNGCNKFTFKKQRAPKELGNIWHRRKKRTIKAAAWWKRMAWKRFANSLGLLEYNSPT